MCLFNYIFDRFRFIHDIHPTWLQLKDQSYNMISMYNGYLIYPISPVL